MAGVSVNQTITMLRKGQFNVRKNKRGTMLVVDFLCVPIHSGVLQFVGGMKPHLLRATKQLSPFTGAFLLLKINCK